MICIWTCFVVDWFALIGGLLLAICVWCFVAFVVLLLVVVVCYFVLLVVRDCLLLITNFCVFIIIVLIVRFFAGLLVRCMICFELFGH